MLKLLVLVAASLHLASSQVDPNDACRDCRMFNGVGYKAHATRCDLYYICEWNEVRNGYKATARNCACGLFWKQEDLACVYAGDFACTSDPCNGGGRTAYADPDSCSSFWTCDVDRQITSGQACCPEGQAFSTASQACAADATCGEWCDCADHTTAAPWVCQFRSIAGSPEKYRWDYGIGVADFRCSIGTNFNSTSCRCDIRVAAVPVCLKLSILYTEQPLKDHAQNSYVGNQAVRVAPSPGEGTYNGNSQLNLFVFANTDWTDTIGLDMEFNGQGNANNDGPIFDNCDCDEPSTISLRLGSGSRILLTIMTEDGTHDLDVPYTQNAWNRVQVKYIDGMITMENRVGGSLVGSDTEPAAGRINDCQCAAKIGYAWDNRFFEGLMRRNDVYIRCLPDDFMV